MSEIDVRKSNTPVESIRFADSGKVYCIAQKLVRYTADAYTGGHVWVVENGNNNHDYGGAGVVIESEEHARNFIKALEEAIRIGWFEKK